MQSCIILQTQQSHVQCDIWDGNFQRRLGNGQGAQEVLVLLVVPVSEMILYHMPMESAMGGKFLLQASPLFILLHKTNYLSFKFFQLLEYKVEFTVQLVKL